MKLHKEQLRKRRHHKIRAKLNGTTKRPRLVVTKTLTNIYAQLIDDSAGTVLASSSSLKIKKGTGSEKAKQVGADIAKKAIAKKIDTCVFDRAGNLYHGRIKVLADAAREGGLKF